MFNALYLWGFLEIELMLKKLRLIGKSAPVDCLNFTSAVKEVSEPGRVGGELLPVHSLK